MACHVRPEGRTLVTQPAVIAADDVFINCGYAEWDVPFSDNWEALFEEQVAVAQQYATAPDRLSILDCRKRDLCFVWQDGTKLQLLDVPLPEGFPLSIRSQALVVDEDVEVGTPRVMRSSLDTDLGSMRSSLGSKMVRIQSGTSTNTSKSATSSLPGVTVQVSDLEVPDTRSSTHTFGEAADVVVPSTEPASYGIQSTDGASVGIQTTGTTMTNHTNHTTNTTFLRRLSSALLMSDTSSVGLRDSTNAVYHRQTTAQLSHTFSEADMLASKLTKFQAVRNANRDTHFHGTLPRITSCMAMCFIIECTLQVLFKLRALRPNLPLLVVRCANNLFVAMCAMLLSGFAVVLVDLDSAAKRRPGMRVWISLCFASLSCLQGMDVPYVGILGAIVSIANVCNYWFSPNFTVLLIGIFVVCLSDAAATYFVVGFVMRDSHDYYHWFSLAGCSGLACVLYIAAWWRTRFHFVGGSISHNLSSMSLYRATQVYFVMIGLSHIWASSLLLMFDHDLLDVDIQHRIFAGIAFFVPPALSTTVGKYRTFVFVTRRFGLLNRECRERDGAYIASMMDSAVVEVGRAWWVHCPKGKENTEVDKDDHRRYWTKGRVVAVKEDSFTVRVNGVLHQQPLRRFNDSCDDLLGLAQLHLRCIEWGQMSVEVLRGAKEEATEGTGLTGSRISPAARPLYDGERIDFFISHSWYDDADPKFEQLEKIAVDFMQKNGREPTFWLDHVCINQDNILDGLKTLPVNIFSCNRLIALCGATYLRRLWCVWELCTLLAFDPPEVAADSIIICPAGIDKTQEEVLEMFLEFDISKARCYDPNEEARVQCVINSIGQDHFDNMVHALGKTQLDARRPVRETIIATFSSKVSMSKAGSFLAPAMGKTMTSSHSVGSGSLTSHKS